GPRRLLLMYYGGERLVPGERWRFEVLLKRPWGLVNPGSFNMQGWFASSGIDATGSVRSGASAARRLAPAQGSWHHRLRQVISDRLAAQPLSAEARGVLQTITVADRSALDTDLWRLFQHYGLSHLLVISGLHIALVAGLALGLGRVLALPLLAAGRERWARWLPGLLVLALCTLYGALAGFTLATVRALVMVACVTVAAWWGRGAASAHNLLLAAALLLAVNPLAGLGSGFWLSFGAVACLLWRNLFLPERRSWPGAAGVHLFMTLSMVPLAGAWFGGSSLVAAPANLLMVPLIGLWVVPLALLGAAACWLGDDLAALLWQLAAAPLEQLLPAARWLLDRHPAALYTYFSPTALECALAVLAVVLAGCVGSPRRHLAVALLLLPALLPPASASTAGEGAVHVLFVDVGQGSSVLVYNRHRALLYDTGGGVAGGPTVAASVVLPLLRSRGIRRLDQLVLSHGDSDHSAGAADILSQLPVGQVLTGADPRVVALVGTLPGVAGRVCRAGESWQWPGGEVRFRVLAPAHESGLSRNNASCVVQVQVGHWRLLLPGDIDSERERALVQRWRGELVSDWLLAAHHGSASSTGHAWLKQVDAAH
ncbi:MAG: DNA internalization-related competence protein ComEC/Rec2, partial [Parahaliea sp.]